MTAITRISISGAALAALLSTSSAETTCGLLLGTISTSHNTLQTDDDEAVVLTETEATVTGVISCVPGCPFFNAAGQLSDKTLTQLAGDQRHIGWFSCRPGSVLHASLRETAVTREMLRFEQASCTAGSDQQPRPLLFACVSGGVDHGGATVTLQHRFFQCSSASIDSPISFQPLPVHTTNLARAGLSSPRNSMPVVQGLKPEAVDALTMAASQATAAIRSIEMSVHDMLGQLQGLCAVGNTAGLEVLQLERQSLLQELSALHSGARGQAAAVQRAVDRVDGGVSGSRIDV